VTWQAWKCGYPPCTARAEGTKTDLRALGWVIRKAEALCPLHAMVKALF
jgi:hypothetical protein